jgi:hypothetical protein
LARLAALGAAVALTLAVAGCGIPPDAPPAGTSDEILERVFAEAGLEPFGPVEPIADAAEARWFLGSTDHPPFTDTAVANAGTSVDPRIAYVLRTAGDRDAADVLRLLDRDVDPDRLLAVSFEREDALMDRRGNVVFLVIAADQAQRNALADAFARLE